MLFNGNSPKSLSKFVALDLDTQKIIDQSVLVAEIKVFIKLEVKKTPKNDFVNV